MRSPAIPQSVKFVRNRVLLVLIVAGLLAGSGLAFLTAAPNRLVTGTGIRLDACLGGWRASLLLPAAASIAGAGTCVSPATVLRTTGSNEYSVSAITAGAIPIPPMPSRLNAGTCNARKASGASNNPNSAIEGTVWMTFNTANTGARHRSRRNEAIPNGTPRSNVGNSVNTTIWRCLKKAV